MTILDLTAAEAVKLMQRGDLKVSDYVDSLLQQIKAKTDLNAFISIDETLLRKQAADLDSHREGGGDCGRLFGLPIAVKDNIETADYVTTGGTGALKNHRPDSNAPSLQKLLDQGALVLGKTNLHELAFGITSNNGVFGSVRNPYNSDMIAGGSSGGSATVPVGRPVLREVALDGRPRPRLRQRMRRHATTVREDRHAVRRAADVDLLAQELEGHRIEGFRVAHMAVPPDLEFRPSLELKARRGQRLEGRSLLFIKGLKGLPLSRPVGPTPSRLPDPACQLTLLGREVALLEIARRQQVAAHILHARLHAPLLLGAAHRRRVDLEVVVASHFAVAAREGRVAVCPKGSPDHSRLEVVGHDLLDDSAQLFQALDVQPDPSLRRLIEDVARRHMAAVAQRQHEHPQFAQVARFGVWDLARVTEVHLRLEPHPCDARNHHVARLDPSRPLDSLREAAHRVVARLQLRPMLAAQVIVDRAIPGSLEQLRRDLVPPGLCV